MFLGMGADWTPSALSRITEALPGVAASESEMSKMRQDNASRSNIWDAFRPLCQLVRVDESPPL